MTARRPIAFLSMESLEGFFTYDHLAADVLRARGREVEFVPWRRAEEWSRFAAVVVRSPWDYQQDPAHFMDVLRAIEASGTPLHNPVAVAEWNLAKTYLLHLERAGVPIVPTRIGRVPSRDALCALAMEFGAEEMVLKPVIGANADGAFRLRAPFDDARAHEAVACYRERECLAQPFLRSIVEEGEVSLFYFFGELSHAIIKRPAPGDFRVQEEHGGHRAGRRAGRLRGPGPRRGAVPGAPVCAGGPGAPGRWRVGSDGDRADRAEPLPGVRSGGAGALRGCGGARGAGLTRSSAGAQQALYCRFPLSSARRPRPRLEP
jgi:hypothetical protein